MRSSILIVCNLLGEKNHNMMAHSMILFGSLGNCGKLEFL